MREFFIGLERGEVTKREASWHILQEDPVLHLIPFGEFPGLILFSMAFGPENDESWTNTWRNMLSVPPIPKTSYYFWIHIFEGTELLPMDSNSTSSPYLFVSCGNRDETSGVHVAPFVVYDQSGELHEILFCFILISRQCFLYLIDVQVREGTLNPIWNQSIGFRVDDFPDPLNLDRAPPIFVSILDKKDAAKNDRFMGHFWYPSFGGVFRVGRTKWAHDIYLLNNLLLS